MVQGIIIPPDNTKEPTAATFETLEDYQQAAGGCARRPMTVMRTSAAGSVVREGNRSASRPPAEEC